MRQSHNAETMNGLEQFVEQFNLEAHERDNHMRGIIAEMHSRITDSYRDHIEETLPLEMRKMNFYHFLQLNAEDGSGQLSKSLDEETSLKRSKREADCHSDERCHQQGIDDNLPPVEEEQSTMKRKKKYRLTGFRRAILDEEDDEQKDNDEFNKYPHRSALLDRSHIRDTTPRLFRWVKSTRAIRIGETGFSIAGTPLIAPPSHSAVKRVIESLMRGRGSEWSPLSPLSRQTLDYFTQKDTS